jgi:hypothetical protein
MELPDLKYDYYDAHIVDLEIGPRREVSLTMLIHIPDSRHWVGYETVAVRFGGIVNFEPVKKFFDDLSRSPNAYNGLHYLRYAKDRSAKSGSLFFEMEFDSSEDHVRIDCRSITVSTGKT